MASPPTHVVVHTTATHIETTTARSKSVYDEVMDEVDFFVDTTSDMALLGPRGPAAAAIPALARHSRTAVSIVETEIAERANADAGVSVATRVAADVSSTSPVPSLHRGNVDVMTIPNPAFVMVPTASATPATSTGTPSPTPSTATTQTKTKKKRKKKKKQVAARCMATVTPVSPPPPAGRTIPVPSCIEDLSLDPHWVPLPSMRRIKGLTTDATLIDAVIDGDLNVVDSPKPLSRKARQRQNAKQRKKAAKQQQQQKQVSPEQPPAGRANRQDYTKEGYVIDTDEYEDITDDSADAVDAEIVKDYLENAEGMDSCLDAMVNLDLGEPPARRVVEIAGKAVDSDNVMDDSSEAYYNSDLSSDFDSDSSSESAEGVPITTRKNRTHHASRTRPGRSLAVQIDAEEAEFEHIYEMAERMMGRGKKGASLLESIPRPPLPALSQHVGSLGRADLDSELGRMSKADRKKLNKFARKQVLLEQRAARAERRLANERTESAKAQRQGKTSPTTKFVQAMPTTDVYDGVKQFLREQNESMYALAADASLPRGMLHLVHGVPVIMQRMVCQVGKHYNLRYSSQGAGKRTTLFFSRTADSAVPLKPSWQEIADHVWTAMATNGQLPTWEQLDAGRWLPASCRPPREMRDLLETADGQAKRRVKAEKTKAKAKSGKGGPSVNRPAPGFVVDENTAALGNTNRGHQLLMRMGWSEGIGINGGIVEPVKSRVHGKHSGLGA